MTSPIYKLERADVEHSRLYELNISAMKKLNRKVIFRGKSKDTGQWIYGYYCHTQDTTYAFAEDYEKHPVPEHDWILIDEMSDWGLPNRPTLHEVEPGSVGQYTEAQDLMESKIFEGDILKKGKDIGIVCYGKYKDEYARAIESYGFYINDRYDIGGCRHKEITWWVEHFGTVIGNVFDNHEYLFRSIDKINKQAKGKYFE